MSANYKKHYALPTGNTLRYESIMGDISKELYKAEKAARTKAANHVKRKLKQKTTKKFGVDSNITKGIGSKHLKMSTIVGVGPPAQAAHLIEFGTDERYHKKDSKMGPNWYTGRIKKDPFVYPTYQEEAKKVQEILSREWF